MLACMPPLFFSVLCKTCWRALGAAMVPQLLIAISIIGLVLSSLLALSSFWGHFSNSIATLFYSATGGSLTTFIFPG